MDLGHLQVIPVGCRAVARAIFYGESVGQDKPPLPGQRGPAGWRAMTDSFELHRFVDAQAPAAKHLRD
jgi:hypothetical protein